MTSRQESGRTKRRAGVFDIRTFIAALIGIYGLVLVVVGIVDSGGDALDKTGGLNINLWAGIGMVVAAVLFQAWAMWRPVAVPEVPEEEPEDAHR